MDEAEEEIERLEHAKKKLQREVDEQIEANEQLHSQLSALRNEMRWALAFCCRLAAFLCHIKSCHFILCSVRRKRKSPPLIKDGDVNNMDDLGSD